MRTFCIQTLGCKVNQYESEQIAQMLRRRGLVETESADADVRIVNTCCVTVEAASKSRSAVRRSVRLPMAVGADQSEEPTVIVTGCWATAEPGAARMPGVRGVVTHHENAAARFSEILDEAPSPCSTGVIGTRSLPVLDGRQSRHQRAFLKIQDGCDAHCTYCIIPQLRPSLWSKTPDEAVEEARRLVDSGHAELVLTGIFLGAYGHATALRRRRSGSPLAGLIDALCTRVPGLRRLRLSSLEPGDVDTDLLAALASHEQVVPHFHLPLQSGSSQLLRRMNRQYNRDDFLDLVGRLHRTFDRPALTTDIIVGFPGETEEEFARTLDVVEHSRFIHIHAFPYSPRPGTAAARWRDGQVCGDSVRARINQLTERAAEFNYTFRSQFLGQTVQILVERDAVPHGRCERYFDVQLTSPASPGDLVTAHIQRVEFDQTWGVA